MRFELFEEPPDLLNYVVPSRELLKLRVRPQALICSVADLFADSSWRSS